MRSRQAKVLHRAGGKALIEHVVETALKLAPAERIFVVVGYQAEEVRKAVAGAPGGSGIGFIEQTEQKGTGHALLAGREALAGLEDGLTRAIARRYGTKSGNAIGRPKRIFDRGEVIRLRESGLSIEKIASQMRLGVGTVVRVIRAAETRNAGFQKASA